MIVSIHWNFDNGVIKDVFEVDRYRVSPGDHEWEMKLQLYGGPEPNTVWIIDKETDCVYVMNDEGKTVDSYTWNAEHVAEMKERAKAETRTGGTDG